ncbi:MAG TPA: hypothetical protein VMT28_05390 [Terriglobales bacterium]|nr:hypothetical protein [Terriglobales bacterium]
MRIIQKRADHWVIALEPTEQLQAVVESWARASFEMAGPAGIGAITSFDPATQWRDVEREVMNKRYAGDPSCVLEMDYVAGRRCKTTIVRGRKYLKVYPGEGREEQIETMYLLATKHLAQKVEEFRRLSSQTRSVQ